MNDTIFSQFKDHLNKSIDYLNNERTEEKKLNKGLFTIQKVETAHEEKNKPFSIKSLGIFKSFTDNVRGDKNTIKQAINFITIANRMNFSAMLRDAIDLLVINNCGTAYQAIFQTYKDLWDMAIKKNPSINPQPQPTAPPNTNATPMP